MGGGSGKNNGGNELILDTDGRIDYNGQWTEEQFTTLGSSQLQTSRSTASPNSSIFISFNGTQIQVLGMIPPGDGNLTVDYSIDDYQAETRRVPALSQDQPLLYQMLFVSPVLVMDAHNLTIDVLESGHGRNYTFQMFHILKEDDGGKSQDSKEDSHNHKHNSDTAAIVGGVLGSVIFILLVFLAFFYFWRRRRLAQFAKSGERHLPPMLYYARPVSGGSQGEKEIYALEPASVVDTDSKFTFAVRKDGLDESRQSWVSVNMPPTIPDSAFLDGSRPSDWSRYNGSRVVVQHPHPEVSRFSPCTSMVSTPMIFKERTPRSTASRGPIGSRTPSSIERFTSSSLSPGPREIRLF